MFKSLGRLTSLVNQARGLRDTLAQIEDQLGRLKVAGDAGAGMVVVEVNGLDQILSCKIDPELMKSGDRELLEDLVVAATNTAIQKAKAAVGDTLAQGVADVDLSSITEIAAKLAR